MKWFEKFGEYRITKLEEVDDSLRIWTGYEKDPVVLKKETFKTVPEHGDYLVIKHIYTTPLQGAVGEYQVIPGPTREEFMGSVIEDYKARGRILLNLLLSGLPCIELMDNETTVVLLEALGSSKNAIKFIKQVNEDRTRGGPVTLNDVIIRMRMWDIFNEFNYSIKG